MIEDNYEDIINLPHYEPKYHPRMSKHNRAAQFAPFAALTGYEEQVKETARLTEKKIEEEVTNLSSSWSGEDYVQFKKEAAEKNGDYPKAIHKTDTCGHKEESEIMYKKTG